MKEPPSIPKIPFILGIFLLSLLLSLVVESSSEGHSFIINSAHAHDARIFLPGIGARGIAYNPSNDKIYVANSQSSTVSVINGTTNSLIDTILVGRTPVWLEYVPSNNQIYVTNLESNDVYVIDGITNDVVKAIPVVGSPWGIAYDPVNDSIYLGSSHMGDNELDNTVSIINASTDKVVSTISLPSGRDNRVVSIAYSDINNGIYVSRLSSWVAVINGATNAHVYEILLPSSGPFLSIAYNPITHFLYVVSEESDQVHVIDPTSNREVGRINVGDSPRDIAYNPTTQNLYVTNCFSDTVSVIESRTHSVINNIPAGIQPSEITYDSSNQHMYVVNLDVDRVTMIHP